MSLQLETSVNENSLAATRRNNPKIPKCLNTALISVLVIIILSLITYILISKVHDDKNNTNFNFTKLICFPCEVKSTNTNNTVIFMKEGNRCCLPSSEGHNLLSSLISEDISSISHASRLQGREQSHKLPDETNKNAVAAHLYLNTNNPSLKTKVLLWTINRQNSFAFVTSGLNYSESTGIVTVMQQGIYYIYSQLTFNTYSAIENSTGYDQLYQQIWLRRDKIGKHLLYWKQTVNNSREYMPSFLGGNFELNKDDEIYVTASDPQFLYKYYAANVFGLHFV